MKISKAFPSKYLAASDIEDDQIVTIKQFGHVEVQDGEEKPALWFEEFDKPMVLNPTNGKTIAKVLDADDTDDWIGRRIALFVAMVSFQGREVEAIRVKGRAPKGQAQAATASTRADERRRVLHPQEPPPPPPIDDEPVW
jgi:hypothetical protein